jgi:anti-anti-sigma regulatory factor
VHPDDAGITAQFRVAEFRVESRPLGSRDLLVLAGQIGPDAAGPLYRQAEQLATITGGVDLDWREAEAVSGSCLQVLLALGIALSERALTMRVSGDNPQIRQSLELAGLSSRFPCVEAAG